MNRDGILTLFASRARMSVRLRMLNLQRRLPPRNSNREARFFDSYPLFYSTSTTAAKPNRLNERYKALIEPNKAIIQGRSVLDIASHDGRWSLAAYKAGARHVLGIEAREHLVQNARANIRAYGVPEDRIRFLVGDVFEEIERLAPGSVETVFCFGFFYHTMHHNLLLSKIARLRPKHVIFDTGIDLASSCIVEVHEEEVATESNGAVADAGTPAHIMVGKPSKSALELMLSSAGFTFSYYNWHEAGIKRWDDLEDYYLGSRVSLVATPKSV